MQTIMAIASLALLMWAEPASAQSPYSLTVSRHHTVTLSESDIDEILRDASEILQNNSAHACNATFKRNGPVKTFTSPDTPAIIRDRADRDAVHSEDSDIKIVKEIGFCRLGRGSFRGCAWPPRAGGRGARRISVIFVERPENVKPNIGRLWAHELGHRMGLRHVSDKPALMGCSLNNPSAEITKRDCECFLSGPGSCTRSDDK
jgi:hypothetical protein